MVVFGDGNLPPLLEGESLRTCGRCGHIGIRSPDPTRRSFYMGRSFCVRCQSHNARAQRLPVAAQREMWRQQKARQRANNPELAKRDRQYHRSHRKQYTENQRISRWKAKEEKGMPLKTRDAVKSTCGASRITYAPEPCRAWLWTLIREEQRRELGFVPKSNNVPKRGCLKKVAATLEVSVRTLYSWLNTATEIDEMTLDRACTHHGGIMPWEVLERFAHAKPPTLAELELADAVGPVVCRSPGCSEPAVVRYRFRDGKDEPVVVRKWCGEHGDALERARDALEGETKRFRSTIGKKGTRPTCCRPGCFESRLSTERYCDRCTADGWREEDYDG